MEGGDEAFKNEKIFMNYGLIQNRLWNYKKLLDIIAKVRAHSSV